MRQYIASALRASRGNKEIGVSNQDTLIRKTARVLAALRDLVNSDCVARTTPLEM